MVEVIGKLSVLLVFCVLFVSGCTTQEQFNNSENNTEPTNLETLLSGTVYSNKTRIVVTLHGQSSFMGPNVRVQVIDPFSAVYDVDQPAPGLLIPLFLKGTSNQSQLRIYWSDTDGDNAFGEGDQLRLTTLSEHGLRAGEWHIELVPKTDQDAPVYSSEGISIPGE